MYPWMPYIVHLLHVLAAAFFIGTRVLSHVSARVHGQLPATQGRAAREALFKPVMPFMPVVAILILGLGPLRGTLFGQLKSWDALFTTAYGNTFLFALLATIAYMAWSGKRHGGIDTILWEGEQPRPDAARHLARFALQDALFLGVIVGAMVLMRFGL